MADRNIDGRMAVWTCNVVSHFRSFCHSSISYGFIKRRFVDLDFHSQFITPFPPYFTAGRYKPQGEHSMKKFLYLLPCLAMAATLAACSTEADRVSYNLSQQADNFNDVRQITVINCLQGDVLFQMTGKMSITADTADNQLEILVEDENGEYKKHFIGLSDNVTYVVEDVTSGDVNQYKYTLNFNPKMWLPEVATIE